MKVDLGIQPYIMPMPVLIIGTYNEDGSADAMNAAWGTLCDMHTVALYLSAGHKTVENIRTKKAFTVAMADEEYMIAADYVGLVSAHTEKKKIEKSGFTVTDSPRVDAPIIEELPLTLECELDHIDGQSGCVYGRIVNVLADEKILDEGGNVDLNKLHPISYDPASRSYFTMGGKAGKAFGIGAELNADVSRIRRTQIKGERK